MKTRIVGDISGLPDHEFGLKSTVWWGLLGFMAIEMTGFALAIGAYLYIRNINDSWPFPPDQAPLLLPGIITTILFAASEVLNRWLANRARAYDEAAVKMGVLGIILFGVAIIVARFFELPNLHTRWDVNAYGSVTWLLMFLHTLHVITDWVDTVVLGVWLRTHKIEPTQFSEVYDNCGYWTFVVWSWVPIWLLVYFAPRLM
ncbi:MAG: cytochrome C oxidase subunit III [Parcubacteria group bacterium]